MKILKTIQIFILVLFVSACRPHKNEVFAFEGLQLGDSYSKVKEKYINIDCKKSNNFNCVSKDEEGGVRFGFNVDEKLISIEHYWATENLSFGQILKAYENKFGKPTHINTYKWGYNSDYVWCKDKECDLYRSLTFNTPKDGKCTPLSNDDFYSHEKCKGASLSFFTFIADKNYDGTWYDKNSSTIKNIK